MVPRWIVKKQRASKAIFVSKSKDEAWSYCQTAARADGGTAYLQNIAGKVETEIDFS